MDTNENYIYFVLKHKNNEGVELLCCIETSTINNDEVDCEYLWCDGIWRQQIPHYWSVDNQNATHLLNELIFISANEWDFISQAIIDWENTIDEVFIHHFKNCTLKIGYDYEKFELSGD